MLDRIRAALKNIKYMGNASDNMVVVYGKAGRLLEDYLAENIPYNYEKIQRLFDEFDNNTFKSHDSYEQWRGHVLSALGTALELCAQDGQHGWSISHKDNNPANTRMYNLIEQYHGKVGSLPSYVP